jgi:hypothetical protein
MEVSAISAFRMAMCHFGLTAVAEAQKLARECSHGKKLSMSAAAEMK